MSSTASLTRQIACAKREVQMRKRVYPGLVRRGTMTEEEAADELVSMQAILATLESVHSPPLF